MSYSKSKDTGLKFIGGSVILALVASGITYYTISSITAKIPVYVAKQSISKGDPLSKDLLKVVNLPKGGVPKDALTPKSNIETRITNKDMATDDILRAVNTIDLKHDSPSLLSARLKVLEQTGLVGGEIPIDSVQGMLDGMKTGDRVYVVGVEKGATQADTNDPTGAKTATSNNTKVVGKTVVDSAIVVGVKKATDGKAALVIAMTKGDAINVAVARESGKVYAYLLPFGQGTQETVKK